jgi:hypothetical protein
MADKEITKGRAKKWNYGNRDPKASRYIYTKHKDKDVGYWKLDPSAKRKNEKKEKTRKYPIDEDGNLIIFDNTEEVLRRKDAELAERRRKEAEEQKKREPKEEEKPNLVKLSEVSDAELKIIFENNILGATRKKIVRQELIRRGLLNKPESKEEEKQKETQPKLKEEPKQEAKKKRRSPKRATWKKFPTI